MSEKKEEGSILAGIYGLGLIGFTAGLYSMDGFWLALAKSLIWPVYMAIFIYNKFQ